MERYSIIRDKMPREFVLLQGTGCRWRRWEFCDYHSDVSDDPFEVNRAVLEQVTGEYGVLDVINSGSAMELDEATIDYIKKIVGNNGNMYSIDVYNKFISSFQNVDQLIINELSDLFMGIF